MRYEYITDTLEIAGSNTVLMDGTVKELKAFEAGVTYTSWDTATKVLIFELNSGNLAPYGQITFTEGANSDIFNYEITTTSGTTITCVAHRLTSDATLVGSSSTGIHTKTIIAREGVKIVNNTPADMSIGFNANITVGGNGIQIPTTESKVFPLTEDIKIYAIAASGNATIIEYK